MFDDAQGPMGSTHPPELSFSVRAAHATGSASWPGVALSIEDFARHVEERVEGDANEILTRHGDDLFLACACARGDARAIELFSKQFLGAVPTMVARIVPPGELMDELVQSLHELMLVRRASAPPHIAEYRGTGSLAGWVRISATRAAVRMKNRAARFASSSEPLDREGPEAPTVGPERLYVERRYGPAFQAAFREALVALPDAPRELLRRYYVDGLTIDQLAEIHGIHRATAARRIDAARRLLFTDARRRASEQLRIPDEDINSLLYLVASRLELSLRHLV
jgi:RNA polymerase sigma-70 factor (ECF subfamily)